MTTFAVPILSIRHLTHDVLEIRTEKPSGYLFVPGQATEVSINRDVWREIKRPFTFTSIPADNYLEFIIKIYPAHNGMTGQLTTLDMDDELIIGEPWGAISYRGAGLFIAGGAGITPFVSIFRQLKLYDQLPGNKLIFANKSQEDIILENELNTLLGSQVTHVLSNEIKDGYRSGFVSKEMIDANLSSISAHVYLCGPPVMMEAILLILTELGIDQSCITVEI